MKAVGTEVRKQMAQCGWTQGDLAWILGRPRQFVNELCNGRVGVSVKTAKGLAVVFPDTSPEDWMRLDTDAKLAAVSEQLAAAS